jgi:hypothetical protein
VTLVIGAAMWAIFTGGSGSHQLRHC